MPTKQIVNATIRLWCLYRVYTDILSDIVVGETISYKTPECSSLFFEYKVITAINPLNTKLSCWNFNLVNADQFSRE